MSISLLILKGILSSAFVFGGGAKLAGAKALAEQFREFGLPLWTMRIVGALEVAGAVGLWVKPFPGWAALGLTGLMIGAVANHVKVRHPLSKSAPAIVLLVLSGVAAVAELVFSL
jgi:hypothetical protein